MSGICSAHQGHDPTCRLCLALPPIYEECSSCSAHRALQDFESAIGCFACEGKGFRRKDSSYVCNRCAGSMCATPWGIEGLAEAKVSGGYGDAHLTDGETYTFSLCGRCLREIWAECRIKPSMNTGSRLSRLFPNEKEYGEDVDYYNYFQWKNAGGQRAKLATGVCNAREACHERAVLRYFVSGDMTDESFCGAHAKEQSNSIIGQWVSEDLVHGIPMEGRSVVEDEQVIIAWLTTLSTTELTWLRYVNHNILSLLGVPEETGAIFIPQAHGIPTWVKSLQGRHFLSAGTLVYGPHDQVLNLARCHQVQSEYDPVFSGFSCDHCDGDRRIRCPDPECGICASDAYCERSTPCVDCL